MASAPENRFGSTLSLSSNPEFLNVLASGTSNRQIVVWDLDTAKDSLVVEDAHADKV